VGVPMSTSKPLADPQLPPEVKSSLGSFLEAARNSFGDQLRSITLFGSAAEGKLHPTSDVNLIVVLSEFEQVRADQLREPLRVAQAAIQLRPMFVLQSELSIAIRSFAPKFADILRRRVILYGEDTFANILVPREAEIRQLQQQLLNVTLRLRAAYVGRSLREEQLANFIANLIGPIRSAAAALLELEGRPASSPQQAFERLGRELHSVAWDESLALLATIQEAKLAPAGATTQVAFHLLEFVRLVAARVATLSGEVHGESL
jgi:predicted nucleotidyltransferase